MTRRFVKIWLIAAIAVTGGVAACGTPQHKNGNCHLVSDHELNAAAGPGRFTKVVVTTRAASGRRTR
jgi:hypothetical protein